MMKPTIIKFDSIESTSDLLKQQADAFPNFTIVSTDFQTKGRGQFDHVWDSNVGENLLFSILFKDHLDILQHRIKQIILDVLFTFFKTYDIQPRFKEPNDIYVDDKKVCGILIETKYEDQNLINIVVGIGLNVNQMSFGNYKATSMKLILKNDFDVSCLLDQVITIFGHQLNIVI